MELIKSDQVNQDTEKMKPKTKKTEKHPKRKQPKLTFIRSSSESSRKSEDSDSHYSAVSKIKPQPESIPKSIISKP